MNTADKYGKRVAMIYEEYLQGWETNVIERSMGSLSEGLSVRSGYGLAWSTVRKKNVQKIRMRR